MLVISPTKVSFSASSAPQRFLKMSNHSPLAGRYHPELAGATSVGPPAIAPKSSAAWNAGYLPAARSSAPSGATQCHVLFLQSYRTSCGRMRKGRTVPGPTAPKTVFRPLRSVVHDMEEVYLSPWIREIRRCASLAV